MPKASLCIRPRHEGMAMASEAELEKARFRPQTSLAALQKRSLKRHASEGADWDRGRSHPPGALKAKERGPTSTSAKYEQHIKGFFGHFGRGVPSSGMADQPRGSPQRRRKPHPSKAATDCRGNTLTGQARPGRKRRELAHESTHAYHGECKTEQTATRGRAAQAVRGSAKDEAATKKRQPKRRPRPRRRSPRKTRQQSWPSGKAGRGRAGQARRGSAAQKRSCSPKTGRGGETRERQGSEVGCGSAVQGVRGSKACRGVSSFSLRFALFLI